MTDLVLVTGASGLIGRRVCAEVVRRGKGLRALVRRATVQVPSSDQVVVSDLGDRAAIRRALEGVTIVAHFAAKVHEMRDSSSAASNDYRRVNVDATRVLVEEAERSGVRALVFASSVKAVVGAHTDGLLDEATPARPIDPYGISKHDAEEIVRSAAKLQAVIVRLPLVYGPGMKANMLALFRAVDRGIPLPLGRIRNRRSIAYVGNVADAVLHVAERSDTAGETYFVSDGPAISTPALVRAVAAALGRPARLLPVPVWMFRLAGQFGDVVARMIRVPVDSGVVERLLGSLAVDSSKLASTGWRPPFTMEEGLAETAAWYRSAGTARR